MASPDLQLIILSTIYIALVFVFVSLKGTYDFTYNLIGKNLVSSDAEWQPAEGGSDLNSTGFKVHIAVLALLVALPMIVSKK